MIVVAMDLRSGRNFDGLAAVEGEAAKGSVLVEDEELAIAGPVGRFEVGGGDVFNVAIGRGDGDGLERADKRGLIGGRRKGLEHDVGEDGFLDCVFVVRADADADVEVADEGEPCGSASGVQFAVRSGDEGVEEVATLLDANGLWRGDIGFDFVGVYAGSIAVLERGEANAVDSNVDGGGCCRRETGGS